MNAKTASLVAAIIFALFCILPLSSVLKSKEILKNGVQTQGIVIGSKSNSKSGTRKITVSFNTSDGSEITASAQKRFYINTNDPVDLWYDPSNPQRIDFGDTIGYNMRAVVIIALVSIFCFFLFFRKLISDAGSKKLIATGKKISAEFSGIFRNEKYRMGEKNPWLIKCKWTDPSNGKEYYFDSKNYTIDPAPFLEGKTHIDIYLNPNDYGKYYMDESFLPKGNNTI